MKIKYFSQKLSHYLTLICALLLTIPLHAEAAATPLADQPVLVSGNVPGNVALALSVEYPTAVGDAYPPADISYKVTDTYLGYFDPAKCYDYHTEESISNHYFVPVSKTADHTCSRNTRHWSGNFLNWALTQTIDPLRQALTGGYRSIDTESLTVLEKAYASTSQGTKVIIKTITGDTVLGATPYKWPNFSLRISRQGNSFIFTNAGYLGSTSLSDALPEVPNDSSEDEDEAKKVFRMYARVQACASNKLKEANCTKYPNGSLKPTGLIQNNSTKLNFAAIAYLYDSNFKRDGGVLRARMAQLGPTVAVPGAADIKNPNAEWDEQTGIFFQNPDKEDASDTGVSNSGVINYLNKFGLNAQGYKSADNVSELYYTAIRYLKHQGNVTSYSNNLTPEMADGFPVITKWDDPVKYACQPNFIIGVGDSVTRLDGNLPGSTQRGRDEPDIPPEVSGDKTVDVATVTNKLGALEGLNNLGNMFIPWGLAPGDAPTSEGTGGTFYIAGLAYDAHTKDIRPDLEGKQTISTYWLDVLQKPSLDNNKKPIGFADRHDFGGVTGMWNQYWLAAKYGGFKVPHGYDSDSATTPLTKDLWDTSGGANGGADGDPDHYFRANNPALMIENLNKAFKSILDVPSGFSGNFNLKSFNVKSDDLSYGTSYSSKDWAGDVTARVVSLNSEIENPTLWSAAKILESQDWNANRYIATSNCPISTSSAQPCSGKGVPFRLAELSNENKANLGDATPESLLNFLRGDRSNDGSVNKDNAAYRKRAQILGDIVNSQVFVSGAPNAGYSEEFNPGYSAFKEANANRQTVLYVGANDGMLHAFNGAVSGGNELFAYVPHALLAGPNNTPSVDGLAALAKPDYVHHYYVDASPVVVDVNFGGGAGDWHSLLVGGLGKGGKSYFAIDVTHPETLSNERSLANAIKWEFSDPRLGYTYGKPVIVKTAKYGWVVILTSGYNNGGQAYFFILKASTGELLQAIKVGAENKTNDPGLASATAYVNDYRDYTADAVYAGDLLGNVWRLDLTGKQEGYSTPIKIAELTSSGSPQPITVAPRIEVDRSTSKRYVFVGTGRFLDSSDVINTQGQSFYAIHDGTNSAFFTTSTAPIAFPFHRKDMEPNNDLKTGIDVGLADNNIGWYIDLGWGANGVGYRIDQDITSGAGVIAFVANLTTGDACQLSGAHDLYALTYGTGKSVLVNNGVIVGKKHGIAGLGASPALISTDDGPIVVDSNSTTGVATPIKLKKSIAAGFKILNWRGIPNGN